jgi:outer membrane beta-barrel protein
MRQSLAVVLALVALAAAAPARAEEPAGAPPETLDHYWRERRAVGVVQKRQFEKTGRLETALFAGWIPNDAFTYYVPVGLRATYFFSESFGLEATFEYDLHTDTRLKELLHQQDAAVRAQIRDRQQARAALDAVWVPFYGKFAFRDRKVGHFDAYLLAGAGTVRTGASEIGLPDAFRPEVNTGVGLRFYLTPRIALRLEARDYIYYAQKNVVGEGGGLTPAWQIGAAFAVLFGGGK